MTRSEALELLSELAAAYPRQPLTENTIKLYASHLVQFDFAVARSVVRSIMTTQRFFPALSELLEKLDTEPAASAAWGLLLREIRASKYNQTTTLNGLLAAVVSELGGFARFVRLRSSDVTSERARFIELYNQRLTEQRADRCALAPGNPPLQIGDAS